MALTNKVRYNFASCNNGGGGDCERTFVVRQTLGRGINESGVLHFSIPGDPNCFTDINNTYMSVDLRVTKADGSELDGVDQVFLVPGSIQALFRNCIVSLNGCPLPPNDVYAFVGTLVSYLGSSKLTRTDMWGPLSGWDTPDLPSSQLSSSQPSFIFNKRHRRIAGSKTTTFYGRITSDFLMSCTQYLPPGVSLNIDLHRSSDAFALACPTGGNFKIELISASIFIKRVRLASPLLAAVRNSLGGGGGQLHYNRLTTVLQHVPESSMMFRWNDVYNNGTLPHTVYIGFVKQHAYYGDIHSLSTYFETAGLRKLRAYLNGRDVLPVPYSPKYVYTQQQQQQQHPLHPDMEVDEDDGGDGGDAGGGEAVLDVDASDAMGAYLGLCQILNAIVYPKEALSLSYEDYLQGCTLYGIQLNAPASSGLSSPGADDIEVEFEQPTADPLICLCFGEFSKNIKFDNHLNFS